MRTSARESSMLSNAMSFINVGSQLLSTDGAGKRALPYCQPAGGQASPPGPAHITGTKPLSPQQPD